MNLFKIFTSLETLSETFSVPDFSTLEDPKNVIQIFLISEEWFRMMTNPKNEAFSMKPFDWRQSQIHVHNHVYFYDPYEAPPKLDIKEFKNFDVSDKVSDKISPQVFGFNWKNSEPVKLSAKPAVSSPKKFDVEAETRKIICGAYNHEKLCRKSGWNVYDKYTSDRVLINGVWYYWRSEHQRKLSDYSTTTVRGHYVKCRNQ
jgi:hypothetical protein